MNCGAPCAVTIEDRYRIDLMIARLDLGQMCPNSLGRGDPTGSNGSSYRLSPSPHNIVHATTICHGADATLYPRNVSLLGLRSYPARNILLPSADEVSVGLSERGDACRLLTTIRVQRFGR